MLLLAVAQKTYPQAPMLLYNCANDIVEMYKAKITEDQGERFGFSTEMYGLRTEYLFRIEKHPSGCLLTIETEGDGEDAARRVSLMFAVVDNMLPPFDEGE